MDGDFVPLPELVKLRRKYGFLLVIDDVSILSSLNTVFFWPNINQVMLQISFSRHMEHLFVVRMVVVHLSCLNVRMRLT